MALPPAVGYNLSGWQPVLDYQLTGFLPVGDCAEMYPTVAWRATAPVGQAITASRTQLARGLRPEAD